MPPRLTDADIRSAADRYGVASRALRAVLAVESGGAGFLSDGRVKILFEAHWMWRRLSARSINPRPFYQQRPDLCRPTWSRAFYKGGIREWGRVDDVLKWASSHAGDQFESYKKACYEACSWGLPQVMGFHYERVGFENVYAFKHWMEDGEPQQLEVFLRFLRTGGLIDDLQRRDWWNFARIYNGTGQVALYSARLAAAYLRARP
jgi:hypothetical protein